MIKVLITGANSYVGTNVEKWLMKEPNKYYIETLDMKDPNWKEFDFSIFDVVFHVAGIAHVSAKKRMKDLYSKINTELCLETANKAKTYKVKQFIFMSSIIVYNNKEKMININTKPNPDNHYGLSKLNAEKLLIDLADTNFKVSIIRAPFIYGPDSKGNYPRIQKLATNIKLFPNINNKRSMLFIYNLSELVKQIIDRGSDGYYFPQNKELISTTYLIKLISINNNNSIFFTSKINFLIYVLRYFFKIFNKLFSDFYYDEKMSNCGFEYRLFSIEESIRIIEKGEKS